MSQNLSNVTAKVAGSRLLVTALQRVYEAHKAYYLADGAAAPIPFDSASLGREFANTSGDCGTPGSLLESIFEIGDFDVLPQVNGELAGTDNGTVTIV
jgi:hypothetical protein